MKKQEFLNELQKRFKFVKWTYCDLSEYKGLGEYKVKIAVIQEQNSCKRVLRDTIFFFVLNETKSNEEILDMKWGGSHSQINKEIKYILITHNIHTAYECEKFKKGKSQ